MWRSARERAEGSFVIRRHTAALHLALVLTDAALAVGLFIGLSFLPLAR